MKPPIFVYEPVDLQAFSSVADAERYLEPIDVQNDTYEAYDSEGRLLLLKVVPKRVRHLLDLPGVYVDHVVIEKAEKEPHHKERLRDVITQYLEALSVSGEWVSNASFERLVETAAIHAKTE